MRTFSKIVIVLMIGVLFLGATNNDSVDRIQGYLKYYTDSSNFFRPIFNLPEINCLGSTIDGNSNGHIYQVTETDASKNENRVFYFWNKNLIYVKETRASDTFNYFFDNKKLVQSNNPLDYSKFLLNRSKRFYDTLEFYNNEVHLLGVTPSITIENKGEEYEDVIKIAALNPSQLKILEKLELQDTNFKVLGFQMNLCCIPGYTMQAPSRKEYFYKPLINVMIESPQEENVKMYIFDIKILTPTLDTIDYPGLTLIKYGR